MDKAKLLGDRMRTEVVNVPGLGDVTVRELSRASIHLCNRNPDDRPDLWEADLLHFGLVDPALTKEEALEYMKHASHSEVQAITDAISRLSKLGKYAAKEAAKSPTRGRKSVA